MSEVQKPKEFTDAEAEAFTQYLTTLKKSRKKTLVEALLETTFGQSLIEEWVKKKGPQLREICYRKRA